MCKKTFLALPFQVAILVTTLLISLALPAHAQGVGSLTMVVNCDKGDSIQAAVNKSREGTKIFVSGDCNEHVDINLDRISLIGKPSAKLTAPPGSFSVITIRGRNVEVINFDIDVTGVQNGIHVHGGSWAVIAHNTIRNGIFCGINVWEGSFASIDNNTIADTGSHGVFILFGATANIIGNTIRNTGDIGIAPTSGSFALILNNEIQDSGASGIWVRVNSGATIAHNIISGSAHTAIGIVDSGSADIAGNTLTDNGSGVIVERNASVTFPSWDSPNSIVGNHWYGVQCGKSGSLEVGIPQDYGTGNFPANELIDPGCDHAGF